MKKREGISDRELIRIATDLAGEFEPSGECAAGSVAAALMTRAGTVYTGISIDAKCSLGFCAEHAAVAEMLKARESEIAVIVAVDEDGRILAPCGRCRELLWQVSHSNAGARIILGPDRSTPLTVLLPQPYRSREQDRPEPLNRESTVPESGQ